MSRYLLDTNIVSEFRKPRPDPRVSNWYRTTGPMDCYVSIITFAEIAKGAHEVEYRDGLLAARILEWLEVLYEEYESLSRILYLDRGIALKWGELYANRQWSVIDGFLAATALVHNLTLVTRNERHFSGLSIQVLNPFAT